jgi:PAS domain S-box-containing protein
MNTSTFFEFYYNNAEVNSMLIMDSGGIVLDVNHAFTNNFGYEKKDIKGYSFELLFTQKDKEKRRPEIELSTVLSRGQSHDENYVVDKDGHAIWCTGESLLVNPKEDKSYIVKDIVNLQSKKQLQLFLKSTEELLERIFETSKDIPMLILDGSMKIERANMAFLQLFELEEAPLRGSRFADLNHQFWSSDEIKNELRKILVTNQPLKDREFQMITKAGVQKKIIIDSRIIEKQTGVGRQIFVILEELTT